MFEIIKRHIVIIIVGLALFVGIVMMNKGRSLEAQPQMEFDQPIELAEMELETEVLDGTIIVDVKGEVQNPGVYEVNGDNRVTDVINIAEGFTDLADQTQINLAQKVHDEMVIIVPKEGEQISNPIAASTSNSGDGSHKIKINTATLDEITTLNGIGPKKAQAILDYLEENGPFQSVEDLTNVSGIGEKTVENMKDNVIIP